MRLEHEIKGTVCVFQGTGARLDARVAVDFKKSVNELVAQGNRRLLFDMSGINFMDSSGLGALVACLKSVAPDGDLRLCSPAPSVQSLVKLTRLDRVIKIYRDSAEALQDYQ